MKYFYLLITSILFIYLILLTLIYLNQRKLLYLPGENNYLDDPIKFNYEEHFIKVDDGIEIKSWFIKKDIKKYKTLLFFHGNAGNLFNRSYKLNELSKLNLNILIISWRGFSGNSGEPSERNLYEDSKKAVDWLNEKGIQSKDIVLYGESLGTGVAVELGQTNKYAGIILEAPYTSIESAAKIYYPYLPIKLLLKDKFYSDKKISSISIPVLVMHGKKDEIIPFYMGQKIFKEANKPKFSYFVDDDNHMMSFNEKLITQIEKFLNFINS